MTIYDVKSSFVAQHLKIVLHVRIAFDVSNTGAFISSLLFCIANVRRSQCAMALSQKLTDRSSSIRRED